jgi:hypothetical protein
MKKICVIGAVMAMVIAANAGADTVYTIGASQDTLLYQ